MNIQDVNNLLISDRGKGDQFSLHRIEALLDAMGNPQDNLHILHIAGTNGKGSTSAFLESILIEAGYKVGIFSSPHIVCVNESMRINKEDISDVDLTSIMAEVVEAAEEVDKKIEDRVFPFEIQVATMFQYFNEADLDVVILEVGLGGLSDATNVISKSDLSIITRLGLDHKDVLGGTIEEIARQKAGIIKPQGTVVTYPAPPSVEVVFKEISQKEDADWIPLDIKDIEEGSSSLDGQIFSYKDLDDLEIQLLGSHQVKNAALAVEGVLQLQEMGYAIEEKELRTGLAQTTIPARMEVIHKSPCILLDGAHNPLGVESLHESLDQLFPEKKIHFVMGALADKDYSHMVHNMEGKAASFSFLKPLSHRALDPYKLEELVEDKSIKTKVYDDIEEVVDLMLEYPDEEAIFVVFGSFYLVGPIRRTILLHSDIK